MEREEARSQDLNPQSLAPFLVASESSLDTALNHWLAHEELAERASCQAGGEKASL